MCDRSIPQNAVTVCVTLLNLENQEDFPFFPAARWAKVFLMVAIVVASFAADETRQPKV